MDSANSDPRPASLTRPPHRHNVTDHRTTQPTARRRTLLCDTLGRRARRTRISTIISDIDTVLTFEPGALAGIEQRYGLADGRLRRILHERPTALAACIGLLDQQTWLDHARTSLPPSAIDEWLNYHGVPNRPVIDLLHRARQAGCRILLLTNGTRRRYDDLAHHHLTDLAEYVYLSADIGYAKPDPDAWAHVLRHGRADPARTMSIDPHAAWANTSREIGIHAHHFTQAEVLHHALARARAL